MTDLLAAAALPDDEWELANDADAAPPLSITMKRKVEPAGARGGIINGERTAWRATC